MENKKANILETAYLIIDSRALLSIMNFENKKYYFYDLWSGSNTTTTCYYL